ncbi:NAD(P)H-binding protein [Streptomyces cellulosae]|uniref:NAD(P)H-binding protein n=1 Tax=Streptomyces cellulosae TaxID=1968 RepID=UPI0004BD2E95|nr:NAD(P)H-binding protein [Streptomyces cellulosae]
MTAQHVVLVTAATGNVGPHAVAHLLEAGARVRALVLPDDPNAGRLPDGVEICHGDLGDPDSLDAALEGVDGVFLMWPFFSLPVDTAPAVLKKIEATARRVAFVSSVGVHIGLEPVDNNCHAYIEQLLERTTLEWTFLRTTGFHCNAMGFVQQIRTGDVVRYPYGAATRTSVHEADLAAVGAKALTSAGHAYKKYLVTGPEELSQAAQLRIIGEVTGRELSWQDIEHDAARQAMVDSGWPPSYADGALDYFATLTKEPEVGSNVVEEVTGKPARTFRSWALEHADALR